MVGLFVLNLLFFWPVFSGQSFLWNDFPERVYPTRLFASVELAEGRFPFWNPYLFGGIPFFAMIDNAVLYPPNWFLIPWVNEQQLSYLLVEWLTLLHVPLLGIGMYLLCRRFGLRKTGAFVAGTVWMFSGPIVHHVFHGEMLHTMAWLPFILFLFVPALEHGKTHLAIAAGVLWGLAILAGHPQIFLYIACVMGLYMLFRFADTVKSSGLCRDTLRLPVLTTLTFATGVGLAAAALLPAVELSGYSFRQFEWTETTSHAYSLHPRQIVTFVMPGFFGQSLASGSDYWGPDAEYFGHYWETFVYMGILPVFLAVVGGIFYRNRYSLFLVVLALLCFCLSFGDRFPLFPLLKALLPGFDLFRAHARLSMIMAFAVAALAGFGIEALRRDNLGTVRQMLKGPLNGLAALSGILTFLALVRPDGFTGWLAGNSEHLEKARDALTTQGFRALTITALSGAVLFLGYIGKTRARHMLPTLALSVIGVDLSMAGRHVNFSSDDIEFYYPTEPVVTALREQQQWDGTRASLHSGGFGLIRRNGGTVFRIETLEGAMSALRLAHTTPPAPWDRMTALMNVSLYMKLLDIEIAKLEANPDRLPRAFVVHDYVVAPTDSAVAQYLSAPHFDYRTTATLDRDASFEPATQPSAQPTAPKTHVGADASPVSNMETRMLSETIEIRRDGPGRLTLSVELDQPRLVVLSEVYYPAWRAYLNGVETPVYRAYGTLRAIAAEAGNHRIVFEYDSASCFYGAIVSTTTAIALLLAGFLYFRRSQQGT
ncbi:MAG: hypothetical protein FJY97_09075 [candidate division Zixibacteria bacterium]|nr:hypothetical protein [candidate division Zixibacteria bacterium]